MNKITLISLISALSCSPLIHAGAMGGELSNSGFISFEGGYTLNNIDNYDFAIIGANVLLTSVKSNQHYTGRLAAGMINMMDDQFGLTGELGWGYYGRTTLNPSLTSSNTGDTLTIKHTLSGFDALVGIAYIQQNFSMSLKAGGLIQNMQTQTSAVFGDLTLFDNFALNTKTIHTAVLPEVKLGAAYNFDSNWAVTGAYIFALGSSPKTTGVFDINTFNAFLDVNTQNPTLNTFLLGIQYTC